MHPPRRAGAATRAQENSAPHTGLCSDREARVGAIAVDPTVIPYGTRMFIVTNDGEYVYGIATAEDCGGGIKGNHVDLFFNTVEECFQFGVRDCIIYFLGDAEWQGDTDWQE